MKLQLWTLGLCGTLCIAACSKNDSGTVTPPPPVGECGAATPLKLDVPAGYPEMPIPAGNPTTVEGVELGRLLFYDPILSGDSTQACGGCHIQNLAFSDSRPFSEGIRGLKGNRHAPAIVNPGWLGDTFWDGRAHGLEDQATQPVPNEIEMDLPWSTALERLQRHASYPQKFCAAFGDKRITKDRVVKAIAQFERTFISLDSKYDRVRQGKDTFTPEEQAGYNIFRTEVGDCFHCHPEPLFTDACATCPTQIFHNTGLDSIPVDRGRYDVSGNPGDLGKFKAPTLRNASERFSFMHDSRFSNLREVINHYNLGFYPGPLVDNFIMARIPNPDEPPSRRRRPMREGEIDTLLIFLETLDDPNYLTNPALKSPYRP